MTADCQLKASYPPTASAESSEIFRKSVLKQLASVCMCSCVVSGPSCLEPQFADSDYSRSTWRTATRISSFNSSRSHYMNGSSRCLLWCERSKQALKEALPISRSAGPCLLRYFSPAPEPGAFVQGSGQVIKVYKGNRCNSTDRQHAA